MNKIGHFKKFSLRKKGISSIFILLAVVVSPLPLAANYSVGYASDASQSSADMMQSKKVTLNMTRQPIKTILAEIFKQTKTNFIFKNDKDIAELSQLTINVKNVSVTEALDQLFAGKNFTYKIEDDVVTIMKKEASSNKVMVIGKVVDKNTKQPVYGAAVVVAGKSIGTVTDQKGEFAFFASSNDALEIRFIGKKTVKYDQSLNKRIFVEMEEDDVRVDDVVVTGYATVSRADMAGSATTLKVSDMLIPNKTNIADMLQGQVAGMIVTNTSARAGATPKIQIRGQSTLSSELGNQDPIWVVDGIIQDDPIKLNAQLGVTDDMATLIGNQVSWLNPNDIETVTVLKDASATAIYGSRASNGVIVVTTKKPTAEKISVNYSGSVTVNSKPKYSDFNMMNSQERVAITDELFDAGIVYRKVPLKQLNTYDGLLRSFLEGDISRELYVQRRGELETMNTDWFKYLTRTSVNHSHNVSLNGKISNKLSVTASLGYTKNNGMEISNGSDILTGRISMNAQVNKRLNINFSINGSKNTTTGVAISKTGANGGGSTPLAYATQTSRSIPAYEQDGSRAYYKMLTDYKYNDQSAMSFNFEDEMDNTSATNTGGRLGMNLQGTLKLVEWLKYEFTGGYTYTESSREMIRNERSYSIGNQYRGYDFGSVEPNSAEYKAALMPHGGTYDMDKATANSYNIQNKLLFAKSVGVHRFNAMLANEVRSATTGSVTTSMWGFLPDRGNSMAKPPRTITPITGTYSEKEYGLLEALYSGRNSVNEKTDNFVSFFATFAYSYDNRYVLNANVRNDMSNRFGQNTNARFDPTYSFGFKWRVTQEPFMKDKAKWLTALNLQATYGIQGNALLSQSSDLILKKYGVNDTYNEFYSKIMSIPNPYLTWERTSNWNFSVDGTLFNALNFNVDYYRRESNSAVQQIIGYENGTGTMTMNGGVIYNTGIEATLSFSPVQTKDWTLFVSMNMSKNWNKGGATTMTENEQKNVVSYLNSNSSRIVKEGYPLGAMWSYAFSHLDDEYGSARFKYMDIDPALAEVDPTSYLVYSGQADPFLTSGMNFTLRYKRFSVSTALSMILGGKKRLPNPYTTLGVSFDKLPSSDINMSKDLINRWKQPGDEFLTYYPGVRPGGQDAIKLPNSTTDNSTRMWAQSDVMLVNAGFLRCNNLSLTYNFDKMMINKIKLSNLSMSANVSNLFVIASKRFNGFDPELGNSIMPRQFSFSVNIGF